MIFVYWEIIYIIYCLIKKLNRITYIGDLEENLKKGKI